MHVFLADSRIASVISISISKIGCELGDRMSELILTEESHEDRKE